MKEEVNNSGGLMIEISVSKAKKEKLFYFVVTGTVYRDSDSRCLILKRSGKEITHPGLWSPIGGKLEWEDLAESKITRWNYDVPNWEEAVEEVLYREAFEEAGIKVGEPKYLTSVAFVRPDSVPVICPKFAVRYLSGNVKISPDFDDFAWVNEEEIKRYKFLKGMDREISLAIGLYK